jgi:hypothetical protein
MVRRGGRARSPGAGRVRHRGRQHHRLAPGPISPYLSVERQKLVLPEPPKPDDDDNAWREPKRFPVIAGGKKVGRK